MFVCPICNVRKVSRGVGGDVWCSLCGEPEYAFVVSVADGFDGGVLPVDNSVDNFV